ncbi:polysaccharide deacetylase family protein [Chryseobacterium sp. PBS4-4]|uniref:Polysaccharide deacetylase family protein n=1 Tax=Chryseobacterium edaphi TaxID=2976532 RepID=A0ABT2W8N1_9FLAO|nr:polysaccharide deacetylase family protein [Chryseobacterium edaphi]MCU7618577.1 polysaccharide deacetylase family protein [Chryseobacterium edaphi]
MKQKLINFLATFEKENIEKSFPLNYCLPVYHCVSDENLPHLSHIIKYKNVRQFENDLDYFSRYFQFVNWDEFKDFFKGNFKVKKKIALLTFDDGFREFYDVVAPILERKGIYAINFINPAFINNKDLMFRSKESLIIDKIRNSGTTNNNIKIEEVSKINYRNKSQLDQIAEELEIDFSLYLKKQKPYLDFDQLKNLTARGFGISAHSWDHPLYWELALEEQLENTIKSLNYIKENNFLADSFAFPFTDFGVKNDFFESLFKNEPLSYSFGCAGIKVDSFSKNLQRIPMETGGSASQTLRSEIGYFKLKKLLNKNTIIRK